MAFFSCDRTCCVSVLLGPMAHFAVPCVVFLPDMHVLIVTYHAPTPEAADAGPLLSGRVSQVSTMTLDALIPRIGDVLQRGEVLFLPPHWCALGGSNVPRA